MNEPKDNVNYDTMKALENAGLLDKVCTKHRKLWKKKKDLR